MLFTIVKGFYMNLLRMTDIATAVVVIWFIGMMSIFAYRLTHSNWQTSPSIMARLTRCRWLVMSFSWQAVTALLGACLALAYNQSISLYGPMLAQEGRNQLVLFTAIMMSASAFMLFRHRQDHPARHRA